MTTDITEADSTDLTLADQVRERLTDQILSPQVAAAEIGIPTARLIALLQGAPPNFSTQRKVEAWLAIESTAAPEAAVHRTGEPPSRSEPAHSSLPTFERLPVDKLKPNPQNPRRIDDKHPSLVGLAESIKAHDVIEPILVRDLGDQGYMILAGERRWRAARIAGLDKVPCLVRTCDDQTAFEITVTENLQREDLHWLEEARGVEAMLAHNWDAETIAKSIGKSVAWVYLRAKLATISQKWRAAVEDPRSGFGTWPAAMLELVARLPHQAQDELVANRSYQFEQVRTAEDLRKFIDAEYLMRLKSAPWALDDAKLVPRAGACSACPKRSSCQQQIFEQSGGDRCTDRKCWEGKQLAHTKEAIKAARQDHPDAKVIFEGGYSGNEMKDLGLKDTELERSYNLVACKQGDKGAKPLIVADGDKPGALVWKKVSAHRVATDSTKRAAPTAAEKAKRAAALLEAKRNEYVIEAFNSELKKQRDCPGKIDARALLALSVSWGLYPMGAGDQSKVFLAHAHRPIDELMDVVWRSFVTAFADNYEGMSGDEVLAAATAIVKHFGEAWPERLQGWTTEALKKFPSPVAAADKPEKRKAYVKETASGLFRTHDHNYSALLKKKMAADGLSLAQAAKQIGVSVPALRTAIIGKNQPNARTAGKYCVYLGIPTGEAKAAKAGAR